VQHKRPTRPQHLAFVVQRTARPTGRWKSPIARGWHVAAGALKTDRSMIWSRRRLRNFELELEWKIGKAGNAVSFTAAHASTSHLLERPEYQLLDDENADDGRSRLTRAPVCALRATAGRAAVRSMEQDALVVRGNHVEHWLNGRKVVDYELKSADWKSRVAQANMRSTNYGLSTAGLIGCRAITRALGFATSVYASSVPIPREAVRMSLKHSAAPGSQSDGRLG